MKPIDEDGVIQVRPFADWLREQAKGTTHDELGDALHEVVARCRETGKKGSLTLTITIAPSKGDGPITVTDEIKIRLPEFERQGSYFYCDVNGNLTRSNPDQMDFDSLREVPPVVVRDLESPEKKGNSA